MKVIATKPGYFGKLRAAGDVFDVPAGKKATWFTPVAKHAAEPDEQGKDEGDSAAKTGAESA